MTSACEQSFTSSPNHILVVNCYMTVRIQLKVTHLIGHGQPLGKTTCGFTLKLTLTLPTSARGKITRGFSSRGI